MTRNHPTSRLAALLAGILVLSLIVPLCGCGASEQPAGDAEQSAASTAEEEGQVTDKDATDKGDAEQGDAEDAPAVADGEYAIEVSTDSSMFRAEKCTLKVEDGTYSAMLSLPGEGFSRLYFGTAEEAATADDASIYDYYLNDDGLYTFDLPVQALNEELTIAAYGQRRDTWYDHTITFHAPTDEA